MRGPRGALNPTSRAEYLDAGCRAVKGGAVSIDRTGPARRHTPRRRSTLRLAARAWFGGALALGAIAVTDDAGATSVGQHATPHLVGALSGATSLGALPGDSELRVDVELRPRDPVALQRFASDVSTPGDAAYGRFLRPGAFAERFGPTAHAIAEVTRWLSGAGLSVVGVTPNHLTVMVRGTASSVEGAFGTGIQRYRLRNGRAVYANVAAPVAPNAARPYVEGVIGLDDVNLPAPAGIVDHSRFATTRRTVPMATSTGPQPCAAAVQAGASDHVYTANQLASAYDFTGLYDQGDEGSGITIGLFELGPNLPSDVTSYQSCFGTHAVVTYVKVDGGSGTGDGNGEAALDIETAIGLAPRADIDVYQAPRSDTGIIDDFTTMIDDDAAKVISSSWGECEAKNGSTLIAAEADLFEQAAAQGQTVLAASGDAGATDCGTSALAVDDPASQPFVTGVGGTTLSAIGPPPVETAWNESRTRSGAGGGGISAVQVMPSYQRGAPSSLHVVNGYSSGAPCKAPAGSLCREVPDVSADADWSTGYLIYYDNRWSPNGGTSAASPLWGALIAIADSSSACHGRTIGFANPALYDAAATAYASDFHDVTTGDDDYLPDGNSTGRYPAAVGYDMATGLGTPIASNLVTTLCSIRTTVAVPTTTTLRDSTAAVAYGSETKESFSVAVVGHAGEGRPLGGFKVYNGGRRICEGSLKEASSTRSVGSCHLSSKELRPGVHGEIFATFVPAATSSTDTRARYTASRSSPWLVIKILKA